jgi:hypothetical protein
MRALLQDPLAWERVAPYLDRALRLAPDECETWLDELARTHSPLVRALRKLIEERKELDACGLLLSRRGVV